MTVLVCICSAETNSMGPESAKYLPKCNKCDHRDKFRKMYSYKVFDEKKDEWDDPKFHWGFECLKCVQISGEHETEAAAWNWILGKQGNAISKKKRVDNFNAAKAEIRNTFDAMEVSQNGRSLYQLARNSVKKVFSGIVELIDLKRRSLELLSSTLKEHEDLRIEMSRTSNIERIKEIVDLISIANEKAHPQLAFTNKSSGETDWAMWKASTYHDEYVKTKNGYFRYWFVCMAGGNDPCMTAITSKMWNRKFKELSATRNKWKCTVCSANYRTIWGVFVEMQIDGKIYCLRAKIPDDDALDIKALDIERTLKEGSTPQDLYDAIPVFAPTTTQYIKTLDVEKGQYRLKDKDLYYELPEWKWAEVLQFGSEEVSK
jgi:hypothetical protein